MTDMGVPWINGHDTPMECLSTNIPTSELCHYIVLLQYTAIELNPTEGLGMVGHLRNLAQSLAHSAPCMQMKHRPPHCTILPHHDQVLAGRKRHFVTP